MSFLPVIHFVLHIIIRGAVKLIFVVNDNDLMFISLFPCNFASSWILRYLSVDAQKRMGRNRLLED